MTSSQGRSSSAASRRWSCPLCPHQLPRPPRGHEVGPPVLQPATSPARGPAACSSGGHGPRPPAPGPRPKTCFRPVSRRLSRPHSHPGPELPRHQPGRSHRDRGWCPPRTWLLPSSHHRPLALEAGEAAHHQRQCHPLSQSTSMSIITSIWMMSRTEDT